MPTLHESKCKNMGIKSPMGNKVKKDVEMVKREAEKLYQEIIDNGYSQELAKTISDEMKTKGGLTL